MHQRVRVCVGGKVVDMLDDLSTREAQRRMISESVDGGSSQGKSNTDIGEVFSPPRMTKMADSLGLSVACALDLTDADFKTRTWYLSNREVQSRALQEHDLKKPWF